MLLDDLVTMRDAMRRAARGERDRAKRAALARMLWATRRRILREAVSVGRVRFVVYGRGGCR